VNARVRWWIALGLMLAAVGVIAAWRWSRRDDGDGHTTAPRVTRSGGLDVEAFRAGLAVRLRRAKEIATLAPKTAAPSSQPTGKWPIQGRGPLPSSGKGLMTPCLLGPKELCAMLADLILGCDAGDARDCIAVGQYLADTPPRPLIAITFFMQACLIGDPAGCERFYGLKEPSDAPCESEPFACAYRAGFSVDQEQLDDACSLGVADACAYMVELTKDDIEQSRAYLETACQLGNPMTCGQLGHRLSTGCTASEYGTCYPVDTAQASAAIQIACSAGWEEETACK
jgi:hypothetical protein